MPDVFAYPFRVLPSGQVATVPEGSIESKGEAIAVLLDTPVGSRPAAPAFGVRDPAFVGVNAAELTFALAMFGPDVEIVDVAHAVTGPDRVATRITYR